MKTLVLVSMLVLTMLTGCTSRTEYGECIGIADDKDPNLVYKVSAWNLILGVIFIEAIVPPVIVLANETSCPVGRKPKP